MRAESFDLSTTETVEKMFHSLFNDLSNGISEEKAGWRPLTDFGVEPSDQNEFLRRGIVERNSKSQFRLNFKNSRMRWEFKMFNLQFEQLDCFLTDTEKVKKAQGILKQITGMLQRTPEYWAYIIALGWWKMLEVSEMPARVDDILREGFSPKDWMVKAPRSSSQLALYVAERYGEIDDFKEVVNLLEKMGICNTREITLPLVINQEDVQKVMKILRWKEIETELTVSNIKMLAFLWASLFISKYNDSLPLSTEFSLKLNEIVWNSLENLLGKKQSDLLDDLENRVEALTAKGIIWASDILYLPEII